MLVSWQPYTLHIDEGSFIVLWNTHPHVLALFELVGRILLMTYFCERWHALITSLMISVFSCLSASWVKSSHLCCCVWAGLGPPLFACVQPAQLPPQMLLCVYNNNRCYVLYLTFKKGTPDNHFCLQHLLFSGALCWDWHTDTGWEKNMLFFLLPYKSEDFIWNNLYCYMGKNFVAQFGPFHRKKS